MAFLEDEDLLLRWDVAATTMDVATSTTEFQLRKLYLDNTTITSSSNHHILHRILRTTYLKQHNLCQRSTHVALYKVKSGNAVTSTTPADEETTTPPLAQNQSSHLLFPVSAFLCRFPSLLPLHRHLHQPSTPRLLPQQVQLPSPNAAKPIFSV